MSAPSYNINQAVVDICVAVHACVQGLFTLLIFLKDISRWSRAAGLGLINCHLYTCTDYFCMSKYVIDLLVGGMQQCVLHVAETLYRGQLFAIQIFSPD